MRAALPILAILAFVGITSTASASPFWQQKNKPPAQHQADPSSSYMGHPQSASPNAVPTQHLYGPGPHNGDWLRKYGNLPPSQQEQKLQSDPVFRSLTPEKQQSLLNRLRNFNSLTPSKKQQVLNRMERYEHLTPEQQRQADGLYKEYRSLPADQQTQVSQAYRQLQKMTPDQREQYFNSDEFRNGMNDEQRSLLRGMSELYPNPAR
jgi:uncharacterized protein DUF3106